MKRHLLKLVAHRLVTVNYNQHEYFAFNILQIDLIEPDFDWLTEPTNQHQVKTLLSKINIVAFCPTGGAIKTSFHTRTVQNIIKHRIIPCVIVRC